MANQTPHLNLQQAASLPDLPTPILCLVPDGDSITKAPSIGASPHAGLRLANDPADQGNDGSYAGLAAHARDASLPFEDQAISLLVRTFAGQTSNDDLMKASASVAGPANPSSGPLSPCSPSSSSSSSNSNNTLSACWPTTVEVRGVHGMCKRMVQVPMLSASSTMMHAHC